MSIITISREYGAGGRSIGKAVAEALGIEIYDKDIIRAAAKDSGLDTSVVEQEDEQISRTDNFWRMITPAAYVDRREAIHEFETRMILKLAMKGDCVIVGRCADAILNEANIDCLNVFLYANDIHRAVRVAQLIESKNANEVHKAMKRIDKARHSYYERFTTRRWGEAANYNLCLDTGLLGYDTSVRLICDAARSLDK